MIREVEDLVFSTGRIASVFPYKCRNIGFNM
jgi:hypothetical protein